MSSVSTQKTVKLLQQGKATWIELNLMSRNGKSLLSFPFPLFSLKKREKMVKVKKQGYREESDSN